MVDNQEFAESKKNSESSAPAKTDSDGFMDIPSGDMEDLPFA